MKQSQSRSSKIDVKSRHRCWLESFLRADWNHKAAETVWQRHTLQFHCSTVWKKSLQESCFNSLYKRPLLYLLKPSGKAPARVVSLSDVQMMKRIMSRCTLCSQIISTCFMSRWKSGITVWWDIGVPKVPFHFGKKKRKSFKIWLICLGVVIIKKDTYRHLNSVIISHQMLDLPLLTRCLLVFGC